MKFLFIGYCYLFILISGLFAQSVTKIAGYVFSEDGRPLENVNVVLIGTSSGAATDSRGYFEIKNIFSGDYTVSVSHVGYQSTTREHVIITKDVTLKLNFYLHPVIGTVEDIVIQAKRDSTQDTAFKISLSSEQIRNSPARTLGELLAQIPGIEIIENGAGSGQKQISIRGSNPNQVLVLLDGIPLNDPLTGEADLNLIPLSIIEDVSIHKGGNAAQSGGGSLAGQVDIRTKSLNKSELQVGVSAGSFEARGIQASLSGSVGRFSLFVNYDFQKEKGNFPYAYNELDGKLITETRRNAHFNSGQFFIKTGFQSGSHTINFQANIFQSDRGLPGTVFFWTPYASAAVTRNVFATAYSFTADKLRLSLQLSAYQNKSEYKNLWPEDPPLEFKRVLPYHTNYQLKSYQGDLKTSWQWFEQYEIIFSFFAQRDQFKDDNLLVNIPGAIQEANNLQAAVGIENNWRFLPKNWLEHSLLKMAIRYDDIDYQNHQNQRKENHLSPKIGFILGNESNWFWNIQANLGQSFRSPTFADLYYQDFRVQGNAELLPEQSVDVDVGIRFGIPWIGKPEISANYFRQKIENLIVWELGSFSTWRPTNLNAQIEGMEFGFNWTMWKDRLVLNFNHIELNARNRSFRHTTHNKLLIYRPEQTTRFGVDFQYDHFFLTYQKRIVSKRYVTAANTVSLPGYHVDDITFRITISSGPLVWSLRGMLVNIFDTHYEIIRDAPLPGRHWRAGLEVRY